MLAITNLIGGRTFLNFISGRYHAPREENRFVRFVDIVGSTGLAERLGGVGIHRFLDRTFRLLTVAVADYRGEILNYIGDEVIIGEIGDVKRGIVFNGDVMNTAARLEELSRNIDGGFLVSRAAMERFNSSPPLPVHDLGRLPIRGRADGIDVLSVGAQVPI